MTNKLRMTLWLENFANSLEELQQLLTEVVQSGDIEDMKLATTILDSFNFKELKNLANELSKC